MMNSFAKQKGLTLIELMVSLLIGLIVVAASVSLFTASQQTSALQLSSSNMQNQADFALKMIAQDLKLAGYSKDTVDDFSKRPFNWFYTTEGGAGTANDGLSIYYEAVDSGVNQDCDGTTYSQGLRMNNTYRVDANGLLTCNGVPLVDNVISFQVLFGMDSDDVTGPDLYLERNEAALYFIQKKAKPVTVSIGLLMGSDRTFDTLGSESIKVLNESKVTVNDKRMHLLMERTVTLYNML